MREQNKQTPIGVFDSGLGGLSILKALLIELPNFDYIYLGDNLNAPYGDKTPQEIFEYTLQAVEYLFSQGCPLVILACNTASAVALRRIQQEILPKKYPHKKVLGILIPTIEQITQEKWKPENKVNPNNNSQSLNLGILATSKTVESEVYPQEILKRNPKMGITQVACPKLVPLIEAKNKKTEINSSLKEYLSKLPLEKLDSLLLACTHYELISEQIKANIPSHISLYKQPRITAKSLKEYILNHPELNISQNAKRELLCTKNSNLTQKIASKFLKNQVRFKEIKI